MKNDNPRVKKRADPYRWTGVYIYEGSLKYQGKPDLCYWINYKIDGRLKWEKIGWKSEGYSAPIAAEIRGDRIRKGRHGGQVKTHKEIRAANIHLTRTVAEIGKRYFEERKSSLKGYKTDLNRFENHVIPLLGDKPVSQISEIDVARVKKALPDRAPGTVWNVLEVIRRIVNYGAKNKLCPRLDFTISMPTKNNEVVEFLTPEQVQRLMNVMDFWPTPEAPRMLKLAMFTGMRRSEIFDLQDKDLNFTHQLIGLPDPKGGKSVSIPMNPIARQILKEQQSWRDERYPDSLFVFPGRHGGRRTDSKAVKAIKREAQLPEKFRIFHGLRHHYAVTLANSGEFTLDMIGELLTHKSHAMTKRYASFLPDSKQKASIRAGEILQGQYQAEDKEGQDTQKVVTLSNHKKR